MKQLALLIGSIALFTTLVAAGAEAPRPPGFPPSSSRVSMRLTDVSAAVAMVQRAGVPTSDVPPLHAVMARAAAAPASNPALRTPLQTMHPLSTSPVTPLGFRRADFAWSHGPQADGRTGLSRNAHDASAGVSTRTIK